MLGNMEMGTGGRENRCWTIAIIIIVFIRAGAAVTSPAVKLHHMIAPSHATRMRVFGRAGQIRRASIAVKKVTVCVQEALQVRDKTLKRCNVTKSANVRFLSVARVKLSQRSRVVITVAVLLDGILFACHPRDCGGWGGAVRLWAGEGTGDCDWGGGCECWVRTQKCGCGLGPLDQHNGKSAQIST